MSILYAIVAVAMIFILAAIPLFPFWKAWKILKERHQDIWMGKGPFTLFEMLSSGVAVSDFIAVIRDSEKDRALAKRDPELVKWCHWSAEVWRMAPRSFLMQIGYFFVFLYFVIFFTSLIVSAFK
jgi:hypothetical protein